MKTILVDLIDTQGMYKGSGVYIRKVFLSLLRTIEENVDYKDVRLVCTYNSKMKILYPDFEIPKLESNSRIIAVDITKYTFANICINYSVDTVFLGFGQQLYFYDFSGVKCRTICVLHDIYDLEFLNNKLTDYLRLFKTDISFVKYVVRSLFYCAKDILSFLKHEDGIARYKAHMAFFESNPNYVVITVSMFSFFSIQHLLSIPKEKIKVLWSPEKELAVSDKVENQKLRKIINDGLKYLLVVSANRDTKNAKKAIEAFVKYIDDNPQDDLYLITIGYRSSMSSKHIILPYLNDSDIEYAYKNCYALLYPSFFEGFGYPPLEVMKYGKPVLSSNVCSMPEILDNAPIWFSPFYSTDIYKAINCLMNSDYEQLCKRSYEQYLKVNMKQREDLEKLVKLILS